MTVRISGAQWKEFLDYVESFKFSYDGWVAISTVTGTINRRTPEHTMKWCVEEVVDCDELVVTGGDIMEGETDEAVKIAELVPTIKRYFCKL